MKPCVRGKTIFLREVTMDDADFILSLRTDPEKNKHISRTKNSIKQQQSFIVEYQKSMTDYYFIICDWHQNPLGTVRIYDIQNNDFCWGSWILSRKAPVNAAIESALLIYDFAFFSLHYLKSHFDVRKDNHSVINFHRRFGASLVREDEVNVYFEYSREAYLIARERYNRYLPE